MPIVKQDDLLRCKPMFLQIKDHGEGLVLAHIRLSVEKLLLGLCVEMSEIQVVTLCEDILDAYPTDSIEDVVATLKNARQGKYGWGHEKRGVVNMIIIQNWMEKHLENKAALRERTTIQDDNSTDHSKTVVDYQAYRDRNKEKSQEKKEVSKKDQDYNNWKQKYLTKNKPDNDEQH